MAKKITKSHPIGSERFQIIWVNNLKIQNVYVKNIMFVYSLPMSTSTWRSDYHIGPGGYMSGELKLENINMENAPTQRSHHLAQRSTIILSYTTKILQYSKDLQDLQPRPSLINKTLIDCCLHLNTIIIDDLECSLR
jgi:hypothetical protein